MSSRGTGSDITLQEAIDLLHKLMTESTKVVANVGTRSGVRSSVFGSIKLAPDETLAVTGDERPIPSAVLFDPRLAVRRTYGDNRSMFTPGEVPVFVSALCFEFDDGSSLCLFEPAERS